MSIILHFHVEIPLRLDLSGPAVQTEWLIKGILFVKQSSPFPAPLLTEIELCVGQLTALLRSWMGPLGCSPRIKGWFSQRYPTLARQTFEWAIEGVKGGGAVEQFYCWVPRQVSSHVANCEQGSFSHSLPFSWPVVSSAGARYSSREDACLKSH